MALATTLRSALRTAARSARQEHRAIRSFSGYVAAAAAATHPDACAAAAYAAAAAAATSASSIPAAAPSCQTLDEARALIQQVYGRAMWDRIQQRSTAASASAAAAPPSLLHVTSLFHPRSGCSSSSSVDAAQASNLYTLQVTGSHSPRHALDRFALCLARSLAAEVIYSGKVLREEPHLRCEIDAPFAGGLGALRSIAAPAASISGTQPALSILTRASSLSDVVGGLDFAHPIWDAHCGATQPITVYHARPSFGESIRSALRRVASNSAASPAAEGHDDLEVELALLVRAVHEEDALTSASSSPLVRQRQPSHLLQLRHPHKLIRFRCTHNATALAVVQQMQSHTARRLVAQLDPRAGSHPFLSQLSIEAGPQVTRSLYGDLLRSPSASSAVLLRPPVQTLLLSVYRGAIPPEHYRRFLVYPSSHALAASNAAAVDSASAAAAGGSSFAPSSAVAAAAATESLAPPAPTLTLPFLHRFYRLMSEYHCARDKDWSFLWFERKE